MNQMSHQEMTSKKDKHYTVTKGSILQKDIIFPNMCPPMAVLEHVRPILENSMGKFPVVMGDLNSPLSVIGKSRKEMMRNQVYNLKIIGSILNLLNIQTK